jgi:Ca2+-binding EF-hand superfamily protein
MPRIESRMSQFCREQFGIDELQLSPFRDRTNSAASQRATPANLRQLLQKSRQNRTELARRSLDGSPNVEVDATSSVEDKLQMSTTSDMFATTVASSRGGAMQSPKMLRSSTHSIDDLMSASTTQKAGKPQSKLGKNSSSPQAYGGGYLTFRAGDRQPTGRLTPLDTKRSGGTPRSLNLRPSGHQPSPFFYTANHMTKDDITNLFEKICDKIEAKATDEAEERAAQEHRANFGTIVANVIRVSRPIYSLARKYVRDNIPTASYKMHLRAMWRFAAGRIIVAQQKQRALLARDAKKRFMELLKEKRLNDTREKKKRRGDMAIEFFAQVIPKKASRLPPLAEGWYKEMRSRFREICDNDKMELTIRDLSGKVDALILRKIDRDHSGTVSFFELLKIVYPSILVKDLQSLMRKWDTAESETAVQLPTATLLSDESKRQIELIFRKCDVGSKGVISKADMMTMFLPRDWAYEEPLWFEQYFPHAQAVVTSEEFMEMMKFCYHPFKHGGSGARADVGRDTNKNRGLPAEVIAAQERARIPD